MRTSGDTTLKDIAEKLNISISTVSRALRNHPDVNTKTKEKVLQLARKLDYEPNELALNLLKGRSNLVAVILPKVAYYLYATAITGIENVLRKEGFTLVTVQTHESTEREVAAISELIKNRVAGFIISMASETADFSHFELIRRKKIPLVFFNRDCQEVEASRVVIDNVEAAFSAVSHLVEQGYKKIAFLGASELVQISNRRLEGYKKAVDKYKVYFEKEYILHCGFDRENVTKAIHKLMSLSNKPDAILAFSDQMAVSAMLSLQKIRLTIPDDIGIMGFNDEPFDTLLSPALTSISQPSYEMGKIAGQFLLWQINKNDYVAQKKVLSTTLKVRGSTKKIV